MDQTKRDIITFRDAVYRKIRSSINGETCADSLLKMKLHPGL
jgi:hypothetical protein